MFPNNCNYIHSAPSSPPLLCSSSFFFSSEFWGLLVLILSCNHSTLGLFPGQSMQEMTPRALLAPMWGANVWSFGEYRRFKWVLCTEKQLWFLYCKLWLQPSKYLQYFHIALVLSAQERLCSVKDLRVWQMSSGKAQWCGLRCYCPRLSALPLHRNLWALDSSTKWFLPWLLQRSGWCLG